MEAQAEDAREKDLYDGAKPTKFQFKSGSSRRSRRQKSADAEQSHADDEQRIKRESRRKHKHKHRSSRRSHDAHPTSTRDGAYYDPDYRHRESLYDEVNENESAIPSAVPDEAFRESLFDALADDEGAAYWEGVYGQPVHIYPDTKPGPDGKLERMSEEEYAEYVRMKMWEKSHQHIVEEREAKERARQKKKEQRQHLNEDVQNDEMERETIRRRMAESLRKGEERKRQKETEAAWERYTKRWDDLKNIQHTAPASESEVRDLIPWPVVSGKMKHVSSREIETFLRSSHTWSHDAATMLKSERVRWHPDKMQQRFGKSIDDETMKAVTAVFQNIDRLWNNQR